MKALVVVFAALAAPVHADPYCHWLAVAPPDVRRFLPRLDGCTHWSGEEGYNAERRREIEHDENKLKCDRIDTDLAAIKRRHTHQNWVIALLDRTQRNEDLPYCGSAQ